MQHRKLYPAALMLSAAVVLAGCGGANEQDAGTAATSHAVAGVAVDGYLARATVYADLNGNARQDPFEPFALTDDQGYFSRNPVSGTDYCRDGAPPAEVAHCLRLRAGSGDATLRIIGGYDRVTGEPFDGTLSVGAASGARTASLVASPLASLVVAAGDRRPELLDRLQLPLNGDRTVSAAEAGTDFLADTLDVVDTDLLRVALKAHKVVAAQAALLNGHYDRLGEDLGLPDESSPLVYRALVSELLDRGVSFASFMASRGALEAVTRRAEDALRDRYRDAGLTLPPRLGFMLVSARSAAAVRLAQVVDSVVDSVVNNAGYAQDAEHRARAAARAVEIVTQKIIHDDPNYIDAAGWAIGQSADVAGLATGPVDLGILIQGDMVAGSGGQSSYARIPADAPRLDGLAGQRLAVDLSVSGASGAVIVYFSGDAQADSGHWRACAQYRTAAVGDLAMDGMLMSGDWARPDPANPYVLTMSADILGGRQAMMLKSVGLTGSGKGHFRFDFDGSGMRDWYGSPYPQAFSEGAVPDSDEACRTALAAQFGR